MRHVSCSKVWSMLIAQKPAEEQLMGLRISSSTVAFFHLCCLLLKTDEIGNTQSKVSMWAKNSFTLPIGVLERVVFFIALLIYPGHLKLTEAFLLQGLLNASEWFSLAFLGKGTGENEKSLLGSPCIAMLSSFLVPAVLHSPANTYGSLP